MTTRNIGLVFDGGGGKGAYQIGVWKALREIGWDKNVKAIAGTSVGGLNAALFIQGDLEKAERIWREEISRIKPWKIQMVLDELIDEFIDLNAFSRSKIDCFLATYCAGQTGEYCELAADNKTIEKYVCGNVTYYNMRVLTEKFSRTWLHECSTSKAVLLATSAIPGLCRRVKISHKAHEDGGGPGGDNSPVYPLAQNAGCNEIIVIHLEHLVNSIKRRYPDISIHEIIPNVLPREMGLLSGTLNFKPEHAGYLIDAGFRDSMALFRKLLATDEIRRNMEELELQKHRDALFIQQTYDFLIRDYKKEKLKWWNMK